MARLTALCVRHPWLTLVAALALTVVAGWSALKTDLAVGTDASLGANHSSVKQFDEFLDRFGGGYPIVIAYRCTDASVCGNAFDPAALLMADAVSRWLEQTGFVSRVSSPATARVLVADDDIGLNALRFVVEGKVATTPALKRAAMSDPVWVRNLVSEDGRVGAIVVELSSTETDALSEVVREVRRAIEPYSENGFDFHLVGEAVMNVVAQEDGEASAARAGALTGGMLFLSLLALLRSLRAVVASLVSIGVASAWTMGLLPVLDWQKSILTDGAATLILVIGCADCVHFVSHFLETRSRYPTDAAALMATARWVLAPCFLTTATTVSSFASFTTGNLIALTQFGVMAAIGISFAFLLTFTLLPALLALAPPKPRVQRYSAAWQEVLNRISGFGSSRRRLVLVSALALGVVGVSGVPKLEVEMNLSGLWGPEHEITRAIDFVSTHLQRAERLEIGLTLPADASIEDPSVLNTHAAVEAKLSGIAGVGQPNSLLTVLRHTNRVLRPDSQQQLPESESEAAELLFLLSTGASGALDSWLTLDQRHSRISFEVQDLSTDEKHHLLEAVRHALDEILPRGWEYTVTGPVALASSYGTEFAQSQARIVSSSTVLVFLIIGIYLRSLPWAVLSMIPNAVALLLLFGAMGHWGIVLNFGSSIVAPIAIGIAADDTIHFLTAYARERRSGKDATQALRDAISGVGEAVIATAIALALGFMSMMASPMSSVADMGLLCAVAILAATAADLLVLPALIATVAGWRRFDRLPERHG